MNVNTLDLPQMLKSLYTFGSLRNTASGLTFSIKNRLMETALLKIACVRVNDAVATLDRVKIQLEDGHLLPLRQISPQKPLPFPLACTLNVVIENLALDDGQHTITIEFEAASFGQLHITVEDAISSQPPVNHVPRNRDDDYGGTAIHDRQAFVEDFSGSKMEYTTHYSFDPHAAVGNIENFTGVVQVPLGIAGPMKVNGEHANGDFLIPMATTEGTLVASYNRGIKVLNLCGGVQTTVVCDAMQRAPVFVFDCAREAREFVSWVNDHIDIIRTEAESTSSVAKLQYIDPYLASKFAYLRFNFTTGDAAGQNMVGKATFAACNWIIANYPDGKIAHFYLESNFATDKKASQVNILHTRGKRVTAEATITREALRQVMRVEPEDLHYHWGVATTGAFLSGANNNGAHSPNAITALFIATGQDVANVSESSAGVLYTEMLPNGDLYVSMTLPSLIVATYGGGTGLPTQRECLEVMGCYGKGKVYKFAEIVAGVVLAGELSLGAAISSSDWVSSHELYGRNR